MGSCDAVDLGHVCGGAVGASASRAALWAGNQADWLELQGRKGRSWVLFPYMVKDIFVAGLAAGALMCCHAAFRGLEGIKRRESVKRDGKR